MVAEAIVLILVFCIGFAIGYIIATKSAVRAIDGFISDMEHPKEDIQK